MSYTTEKEAELNETIAKLKADEANYTQLLGSDAAQRLVGELLADTRREQSSEELGAALFKYATHIENCNFEKCAKNKAKYEQYLWNTIAMQQGTYSIQSTAPASLGGLF